MHYAHQNLIVHRDLKPSLVHMMLSLSRSVRWYWVINVNKISWPRPLFFPVFIPCLLRTDNPSGFKERHEAHSAQAQQEGNDG